MTKPNIKVVIALFESYLAIRKADWNLEELDNGTVTLPEPNSWEGKKVAVCNTLLQEILKFDPNPKKNDMEEWVKLIHELYDNEQKQQALFKGQWIGTQHVLLDVIRAIRDYVITCLKTEEKFKKYETGLKDLQEKHEINVVRLEKHSDSHNPNELISAKIELSRTNKALESIRISDGYLNDYFVDQIKRNDPSYKTLVEADINTFKKNAEQDKRSGSLCEKLVKSMTKLTQTPNNNNELLTPADILAQNAASATVTNPAPPTMTVVTPTSSKGDSDLTTPSPETASPTAPKAPTSKKSNRSALRANSAIQDPSKHGNTSAEESVKPYNTRSRQRVSHHK